MSNDIVHKMNGYVGCEECLGMKNKGLKLGLLTTLCMGVLIGCSQTESDSGSTGSSTNSSSVSTSIGSSEEITLTLWHYYGDFVENQLKTIVDEFNRSVGAEEKITVKLVGKPTVSQLEIEVSEASQGVVYAEEMPDLFLAYSDKVLELQQQDVVADLSEYFTEEDLSKVIDDFLEAGYVNGVQSILPTVKSTELIFLNETLWLPFAQETGYTYEDLQTWEGVYATAKAYYEYTDGLTPEVALDGKALFGIDSLQNYIIVSCMQMGTDIFNPSASAQKNIMAELEVIFKLYIEAMSYGYFTTEGIFRTDDIRSGDIIAYAGSSASFAYFPDWIETAEGEKMDIEWTALPYPYFEDGTPFVLSQGAGVVVTKNDGVREAACAKFLNFFLECNIDFAIDSGYIPVVSAFVGDGIGEVDLTYLEEKELFDNEIHTYELVIDQINQDMLYQPSAFEGSYTVRSELASALEQSAKTNKEVVRAQLASGMSLEEIQLAMDFETQFVQIMETVTGKLESQNISLIS